MFQEDEGVVEDEFYQVLLYFLIMFQYKRVNVENVVQFKRDTAAKKIILGWGGGCLPGVGEEDVG